MAGEGSAVIRRGDRSVNELPTALAHSPSSRGEERSIVAEAGWWRKAEGEKNQSHESSPRHTRVKYRVGAVCETGRTHQLEWRSNAERERYKLTAVGCHGAEAPLALGHHPKHPVTLQSLW